MMTVIGGGRRRRRGEGIGGWIRDVPPQNRQGVHRYRGAASIVVTRARYLKAAPSSGECEPYASGTRDAPSDALDRRLHDLHGPRNLAWRFAASRSATSNAVAPFMRMTGEQVVVHRATLPTARGLC